MSAPRCPVVAPWFVCLTAAVAVVAAADRPLWADDAPPAAMVGEEPVPREAIEAVVRRLHGGRRPSKEQRMQVEAAVLEQLVDETLLRGALATQLGEVSDADLDQRIGRLRSQLVGRGTTLEAFLAESGRDEAGIREQIRLEVALDKYVRPRVTETSVNAYFEEHRREFDGTRLRVSHVLLRPDIVDDGGIERRVKQAESIRRELLQSKLTFEDAARLHSAGPSRHRGGDMGWITREGPMVEAFTKPTFGLAKGDVSKPILTNYGVHLVKVTGVEPGRVGLDTVRPRIEQTLAASIVRELVAKRRAATDIRYAPGVAHYDPATPADAGTQRRIVVAGER